jgi:triacylglycerol lipase
LSPALAQHFDAHTADRPGVRYGCVVAAAPQPSWRSAWAAGLSPYAQGSAAVFRILYALSARTKKGTAIPDDAVTHAATLLRTLGRIPKLSDNDGVVPTFSQFHGELIAAVEADHHDVCGHLSNERTNTTDEDPHVDWLLSQSTFDRPALDDLWARVAAFLVP